MKKIISILLFTIIIVCFCACSSSKYEKHLENVEEYVSEIRSRDSELVKTKQLTIEEDILQRLSAHAMISISDEYETIESEEDKANFLANIQSRISQEMYDRFSIQIDEDDLCEDIWNAYN